MSAETYPIELESRYILCRSESERTMLKGGTTFAAIPVAGGAVFLGNDCWKSAAPVMSTSWGKLPKSWPNWPSKRNTGPLSRCVAPLYW